MAKKNKVQDRAPIRTAPSLEPSPPDALALTPPTVTIETGVTPRQMLTGATVEVVAYSVVLLASLFLRFSGLGARPLAAHEAANAVAAWQFVQGQASGFVGSPLLFSANLLTFVIGSATDAAPRLLPALIGSFAVLLPALLRRSLGRVGALSAALFILVSTSLVYFARDANGVQVAVIAGITAAILAWRYREVGRPRYLYLAALAGAIALTADSAAFTVLLAMTISFGLAWWHGRSRFPKSESIRAESGPASRQVPRNGAVLFVLWYLGLATAFMVNREGLGAAFDLFGQWLAIFSSVGSLTTPLALVIVYEPSILVFGLAGVVLIFSAEALRAHGEIIFLAVLAVVALVVYSVSGNKRPADMVVLVVPLALLAGWFVGNFTERALGELRRQGGLNAALLGEFPLLVVGLVLVTLIYLQFVSFMTRSIFSPGVEAFHQLIAPGSSAGAFEPAALLLALLSLLIAAVLVVLAVAMLGATRAANLVAAVVGICLVLGGLRALSLANFSTPGIVREMIASDQSPLSVRDLKSDLEWQSSWRAGDQHALALQADPSLSPVVHWYLRDFGNLTWTKSSSGLAQALVLPVDSPPPTGNWARTDYQAGYHWESKGMSRTQLFKWLLFRDGGVDSWQQVRLWVEQNQLGQ